MQLTSEKLESNTKILLEKRQFQMKDMQVITEKYKVDIKNYMWRLMMDLNENLKKYDKRYADLAEDTHSIIYKNNEIQKQIKLVKDKSMMHEIQINDIVDEQ